MQNAPVPSEPRSPLVLVANDQEWSLRSLESILQPHGYEVLRAYTGRQALERARAARPDVIILDSEMPDMRGLDVCRALRAEAMEIPTLIVDGMDVWSVRDTAEDAAGRVRSGGGPVFVEARTYRFVGHSRSDPGKYRPPGELEEWRERDPLLVAERRLAAEHGVTAERLAEVAADVERELQEVEESALAAPFPEEAAVTEFKE